jgi:hypothetical protein
MNPKSRIASILKSSDLDQSICDFPTFHLSELEIKKDLEFELPANIRLGHLAEKVVSELIRASENFNVLHENIQIIEEKKTIGELDFIIEKLDTQELIHFELAYKFYLFDPSISDETINNWIGPNRRDSLREKLDKLKSKQFPLLRNDSTKARLSDIDTEKVSQALCFLVSLFVPYEFKGRLHPVYEKAIKGYYLSSEQFISLDNSEKTYYLPSKKEWGIDPSHNETWNEFKGIELLLNTSIQEKQAPLCWQKCNGKFEAFFIVWW